MVRRSDLKPKQVYYEGTWFRSVLEATWAAFFHFAEWKWEHEPFYVGDWVPDFYVGYVNLLTVEVKPAGSYQQFKPYRLKIEGSGYEDDVALVGEAPFEAWYGEKQGMALGTIRRRNEGAWRVLYLGICSDCNRPSVFDDRGMACRWCGTDRMYFSNPRLRDLFVTAKERVYRTRKHNLKLKKLYGLGETAEKENSQAFFKRTAQGLLRASTEFGAAKTIEPFDLWAKRHGKEPLGRGDRN